STGPGRAAWHAESARALDGRGVAEREPADGLARDLGLIRDRFVDRGSRDLEHLLVRERALPAAADSPRGSVAARASRAGRQQVQREEQPSVLRRGAVNLAQRQLRFHYPPSNWYVMSRKAGAYLSV